MTDPAIRAPAEACRNRRSSARRGSLLAHAMRALALYLADRPRRPADAGRSGRSCCCWSPSSPPSRCPFTFKWATDALVGAAERAGRRRRRWLTWVVGGADRHDHRLWRHAHPDGGAHAGARRPVRQGGDARGAPARAPHLRAHAPAVAALSSGAQDRRADARARARPQRHRDHRAHGDPAARADHRRVRADRRRAALAVRLALRRGRSSATVVALHGLHLSRRPSGASPSAAR